MFWGHISGRVWREVLLGPAYWWHRWLIQRSRRWDSRKQQAYQHRRVRRLFERYGGDCIRSKSHYRENGGRYDQFCLPGLSKTMRTGGTSAAPFAFKMDTFARRQKERAYLFDIWSSCGYRPFDLRIVYRGNLKDELISYDFLENCYIISPNIFSSRNSQKVAAFLKELPPFFLHVYPSSLFTFIEIIGEGVFRDLPIRGILAGSEVFPPAQIEWFERRFGLKVAHWYGHSEYASLARRCQLCRGFHFYPTYGYTELIPDDFGRHRIVATSFNLIGTRFVRYDTGDLAEVGHNECTDPFLRVDAIEGREQEFFIDQDGQHRAFGPYLFGIHNDFWDRIVSIQFLQKQAGFLDVRIVLSNDIHRHWLESYLRERFAICSLRIEYVDKIETTTAGKHRYFISQI